MKKKVRRKAKELFPAEPAAHKIMSNVPGRCLRGRWGSVHDVESIVLPAWPYLGDILVSLVPCTFEVHGDTGNQIVPSGSGTGMQQSLEPFVRKHTSPLTWFEITSRLIICRTIFMEPNLRA